MTESVRSLTCRAFIIINSVTPRVGKALAFSVKVPYGNLDVFTSVCFAVINKGFRHCIQEVVTLALASGNRNRTSGALNNVGSNGYYWSSAPNGANARNLNFNASNVNPLNNNNRANGFPVRCVQE